MRDHKRQNNTPGLDGQKKGGEDHEVWIGMCIGLGACGSGKQSAVEGKLVDWNGKPVAGVKITASQVQPIKGYEQLEAVTKSDGAFLIKGLFPSSAYVLKPWSDKWTSETAVNMETAPRGETAVLPKPMVIDRAFSKGNGALVIDLATGKTRFTVSTDGVIKDSATGLEWVVGPDRDTNYSQAEHWVASLTVAGGGWRMPTRQELRSLYMQGVGQRNMDPAFKTTGWWVWAEPRASSSAWAFSFSYGNEDWLYRNAPDGRVFGVRSRPS